MEVIRADHISKVYRQNTVSFRALHDVSLTIRQGEFIALLGRSGSGKSTLLHILAGLDCPTEGDVFIDGVSISGLM